MASVLAVTSEVPWPLDSGGHLRTYHLVRALASRLSVRLITPGVLGPNDAARSAMADAGVDVRIVPVPPRSAVRESVKVLSAAVRREPYVLFARHRRQAVRRTLQREIDRQRPALLYLDHLDSLLYARTGGAIPIVLDMHNVYSRVASRAAIEATDPLRRHYLRGQARLLERIERRAMQIAHVVFAVSDEDARHFRELGARHVTVVPNGVDCAVFESMPIQERAGPPTILFVGALSWPPNASAARFLATQVLPAVRRRLPNARLAIVGKNPGPDLEALDDPGSHITVAANVPDVTPYYRDAHVLAVPLQAGGGTRLKILEAFGAGVPVVSTAIGCEGLSAIDGEHLAVAERDDFADAIVQLLLDPDRARRLAQNARSLARQRYDWNVVGARAVQAACEVIQGRVGQVDLAGRIGCPVESKPAETPARLTRPASVTRPIKVLELRSVRGTGGGPEKTILLGAARADRSRLAVTVTYLRDARDTVFSIDRRANQLDVDYVEVVERHSFDWTILPALQRIVRERAIDIVHAHDYKTNFCALYLSWAEGILPLSTAHGWTGNLRRERLIYYPCDKQLLRAFPLVIAVSNDIRGELDRVGVRPERRRTLHNGIDALAFRRSSEHEAAARRALGLGPGEYAIGSVGRLEPQKRFDVLLEAFARVHARHPHTRLLIAGDGSLRDALIAQANRLFAPGICRLLGHCEAIGPLHHGLDLLVQSSDYEGTPNVVLEAMAFETPVVATKAGGTAEIARDGIDALLVPCGDASALARAIECVMDDETGRKMRVAAARMRVEGELSFDARQQALERIYEEVIAERRAANGASATVRWA